MSLLHLFICLKCRLVVGKLQCPLSTVLLCLGFFLIHGMCSTTSFLILRFKNYCYVSSNIKHIAPQNKPSVHNMWLKTSGREEVGPRQRWTGKGWRQGERMPDKLQLRRQGDLGCWDLVGQGPPPVGGPGREYNHGQGWLAGDTGADKIQELHVLCLLEDW